MMHYHTEYDRRIHKHVAVCSCGWRSYAVSSAGLAGALWDLHKQEEHP